MKQTTSLILGLLILFLFAPGTFAQQQDRKQLQKGQLIEVPTIQSQLQTKTTAKISSQTRIQGSVLFEEGFEAAASGWSASGTWAVGEPGSGAGSGYNSVNVAATNLSGNYPDNIDDYLISPSISLPAGNRRITLRFNEWFEIESGYDYGYIEISADDGASWKTLRSRSGLSDWRTSQIDLSSYAGETIRLRFRLATDESDAFAGWHVDNVQVASQSQQSLSLEISSLNSQNFPNIFANVRVDTNGTGFPGLTQQDFTVFENGSQQTDLFNVTPPDEGGGVRRADVVFLMDNSGSMQAEQDDVEDNVFDFVDALAASDVDFSLGLARYGASQSRGNPIIEDGGSLTSDAAYFKNDVWMRNVINGGKEPGYYAMTRSASNFNFRPGAQRIFIIITDERPNQGGASQNDALTALQNGDITLFALTESRLNAYFQPLTDATGGQLFNIYSSFDNILNFIATEVASTYVVSYKSSNPNFDGTTRNVRIEATHQGNTAYDEASYVPGAAPRIQRTQPTIALSDDGQPENRVLPIEATITDDISPDIQRAILFYKRTPDPASSYQSVEMTNTSGNTYRADIPGNNVLTPGMDYYITATDGNTTSSKPSTNPGANPFNIAVLPNQPPVIEHTPVTQATADQPIDIAFSATDNTRQLERVKLHYRRAGRLGYESTVINEDLNRSFLLKIPAEFVTTDGVEYYIEAEDDWGVASTRPKEDAVEKPYGISIFTPTIRLTNISLKKNDETSFSNFNPSEIVSVRAGAELKFDGIVENSKGEPVADYVVNVYDSFKYDSKNDDEAMQTVQTNSDGKFRYPSNSLALNTSSIPVGVRPFWFNVSATDAAIPFALHLNNGEDTGKNINERLKKEINNDELLRALRVDGSNSNPFFDLSISAQSYPSNDLDLSSSANDNFFLYYYNAYVGPTNKTFLISKSSTGWLERGYNLNQNRLNLALSNLPERFEDTVPPSITTGPVSTPPIIEDDNIGLEKWTNVASVSAKAGLCVFGFVTGSAPVTCVPIAGEITNFAFESIIKKSDTIKDIYCGSNKTVEECVSLASFGTLIGEVAFGAGLSDPQNLSTLARALKASADLNDVVEASEILDVSPIKNSEGKTKALRIELVDGQLLDLTIPQKPELQFDKVQFDEPENPSTLDIKVSSSRKLYKSNSNAVSTPALRIGGTSFELKSVNGTDDIMYHKKIPVSQLPGYSNNPNRWDETINATGTSFETLRGETQGRFCGIGSKTLELQGNFSQKPGSKKSETTRADSKDNTIAKLSVPDQAFDGSYAFVSISTLSFSTVANLEQPNLRPLSSTIYVDANNNRFLKSASLQITSDSSYSKEMIDNARIYKLNNNGKWYGITPASVDFKNGLAKASIDSSGYYAILTRLQRDNSSSSPDDQEENQDSILKPNYPNPFSSFTTITYTLPETQHVNLTIYNVLGRKIVTLVDQEQEVAKHFESFNARSLGLASGVYLYRLVTDDDQQTEKMMFIR